MHQAVNRVPAGKALAFTALLAASVHSQIPRPAHVVIVLLENHGDSSILESGQAPYIERLANDADGAFFSQSYALTHPSQPNYLMLFSGSNQGSTNDAVPAALPFTAPNLGAELLAKGFGFAAYSEDLPSAGYAGATSGKYARKHAPWVNWQGTGTNGIPPSANRPFADFPKDYDSLPSVSFVVPNLLHDMHDGTIRQGDAWLKKNLDGYVQWSKTHNSLLVLTFDEDEDTGSNRIPTIFVGQAVKKGNYAERITHYTVLRTLEDLYGLAHAGAGATAAPITDAWKPLKHLRKHPVTAKP